MPYRVNLDVFRGPLDLLLYLVRKHEVDITEVSISGITDQYLAHLELLEELDVNDVGEFLVMASTLMEIKSREVLPRSEEASDEETLDDPRQDLVRQLLEYKKFRDAASVLEERSRDWQQRFPRAARDLPPRQPNLAEQPIHEVELWDLVSAFSRIMREHKAVKPTSIVYDETPIHVYMEQMHSRLLTDGRLHLNELVQPTMHKSTIIGMFLAVLELVRHFAVHVEQDDLFGDVALVAPANMKRSLDINDFDDYAHPTKKDEGNSVAADVKEEAAEGATPDEGEDVGGEGE